MSIQKVRGGYRYGPLLFISLVGLKEKQVPVSLFIWKKRLANFYLKAKVVNILGFSGYQAKSRL